MAIMSQGLVLTRDMRCICLMPETITYDHGNIVQHVPTQLIYRCNAFEPKWQYDLVKTRCG